jgi:hypothetical protein
MPSWSPDQVRLPPRSVARGEERPDSDVDLLADLPPGLSLFGLGRVEANLEAILGSRVDLIPAADLKPGVRAQVERDLVALRATANTSGWPTSRPRSTRSAPICGAATCPTAWYSTPSGSGWWRSARLSRHFPKTCWPRSRSCCRPFRFGRSVRPRAGRAGTAGYVLGLTAVGQVSRGSPGGHWTGTGAAASTWPWTRSAGSAPW